jgi:hypothetical protein
MRLGINTLLLQSADHRFECNLAVMLLLSVLFDILFPYQKKCKKLQQSAEVAEWRSLRWRRRCDFCVVVFGDGCSHVSSRSIT